MRYAFQTLLIEKAKMFLIMKGKVMKKVLSLIVVLIMTVSVVLISIPPIEVSAAVSVTESDFVAKIAELKARYPHKQYWNEYNGTETVGGKTVAKAGTNACNGTSTAENSYGTKCTSRGFCSLCTCKCGYFYGWQCFGFANLMAYHTLGSYATTGYYSGNVNSGKGWKYITSPSDFYAGDVVRINGREDGHSIFVYKVTDTEVFYAECNWGVPCQINWNGKTTISKLKSSATFVVRMDGNTLKGTGEASVKALTINYDANGGTIADSVVIGTNYQVHTTDGSYAIVRSGPGSSYSEIRRYASGTVVTVTETKDASGYTWGKIADDKDEWMALGDWMIPIGTAYSPAYYLSSSIVYSHNTSAPVATIAPYGQQLKNGLYNNTTFKLFRDGYKFLGWSLKADGSGTIIDQDRAITPEEIVPGSSNIENLCVLMYAIWEKNECSHIYHLKHDETNHWEECTLCGNRQKTSSHTYSNSCEEVCNTCQFKRTAPHHYSNICDMDCDICGTLRAVTHVYNSSYLYDSDSHWKTCTNCDIKGSSSPHAYTDGCDTSCNTCAYTRSAAHTYDNDCDANCNNCNYERTVRHEYSNACDSVCNKCEYNRVVSDHIYGNTDSYDEVSHWKECINCGKKDRTELHNMNVIESVNSKSHKFKCNICQHAYTEAHSYNNESDNICDVCEYERKESNELDKFYLIGGALLAITVLVIGIAIFKKKN